MFTSKQVLIKTSHRIILDPYYINAVKIHLYLLTAKVTLQENKGILLPIKLAEVLEANLRYDFPFEILGTVKDTDTLEILETALGLETSTALEAARLLMVKKQK